MLNVYYDANDIHCWLERLKHQKVKYFCLRLNWNTQPVHVFKSAVRLKPSEQKHLAPDFEFIQMCWQDRFEQGSVNVDKDKLIKSNDMNSKIDRDYLWSEKNYLCFRNLINILTIAVFFHLNIFLLIYFYIFNTTQ